MINDRISLVDYADQFLAGRDVSAIYAYQIRLRCRMLCKFCGRTLFIADLTCELLNSWLNHAKERGLSAYTINAYREQILVLWKSAYWDRLTEIPPLRVRPVKKPRLMVRAYTHEEIRTLLNAASKLRGHHDNGNKRSDFWRAMIHSAYSTALRRGDLLVAFRKFIAPDGTYRLIQRKTGLPLIVQFSPEAIAYIERLSDPNGLALPWPHRLDSLVWAFRRLRNLAGIKHGSLKWLRRSAGTYAEQAVPGNGKRILGHRSDGVFERHYKDALLIDGAPPTPPPL